MIFFLLNQEFIEKNAVFGSVFLSGKDFQEVREDCKDGSGPQVIAAFTVLFFSVPDPERLAFYRVRGYIDFIEYADQLLPGR